MPNRGIDVNEWIAWRNRCETYARDFFGAVVYARYELLRRLTREHDCAQVRELIDILDYVRPILQQDPIGLHPATVDELYALFVYQRHCSLVGKWAIAARDLRRGQRGAQEFCSDRSRSRRPFSRTAESRRCSTNGDHSG